MRVGLFSFRNSRRGTLLATLLPSNVTLMKQIERMGAGSPDLGSMNKTEAKAIELHVIRANEFIRLDVRERLDFEASKQVLRGLVLACRKRGIERALLDLRGLLPSRKPNFTPPQLAGLVTTFREAGFSRQQRLAILYHPDVHVGVRTFAFVNRLRGLQVQPFTEFEEAMKWLSSEPKNKVEHQEGEVSIPITQPKRKLVRILADSTAQARPEPIHSRNKRH
jgi:hypothetical protein